MDTLLDGLYGTLYKERLMYLESATPGVDQPVSDVEKREVEQDVMCPLHHYTLVHSCHASSFISPNKQIWIYNKRGL
jgi:hypothetical protein